MALNDDILDKAILMAVYLQKYKNTLVRQIIGILNTEVYPELVAKIEAALRKIADDGYSTGPVTLQRLQDLAALIKETIRTLSQPIRDELRSALQDLGKTEVDRWATLLEKQTVDLNLTFNIPSASQLAAAVRYAPIQGGLLKEFFKNLETNTADALIRAIRMGLIQGETNDQIIRRITGTRAASYTDGVLNTSRTSAERLVRTAAEQVAMSAREEFYSENTEVLDGVQWVSTLDRTTCIECADLDGQVFGIGEGPRPPFHWICRCSTVPVIKSWRALGFNVDDLPESTRASADGQVPASLKFPQWLAKQSRAIQDDVLGPSRARMFRGGTPISSFVDNKGHMLTLEELRSRGI